MKRMPPPLYVPRFVMKSIPGTCFGASTRVVIDLFKLLNVLSSLGYHQVKIPGPVWCLTVSVVACML